VKKLDKNFTHAVKILYTTRSKQKSQTIKNQSIKTFGTANVHCPAARRKNRHEKRAKKQGL